MASAPVFGIDNGPGTTDYSQCMQCYPEDIIVTGETRTSGYTRRCIRASAKNKQVQTFAELRGVLWPGHLLKRTVPIRLQSTRCRSNAKASECHPIEIVPIGMVQYYYQI